MEFIKVEIEDMSDPEPSRIKDEDNEEQIDQVRVKEQRQELNECFIDLPTTPQEVSTPPCPPLNSAQLTDLYIPPASEVAPSS
ncbi:zinc finger and SCAN domain containing 2-like [Pimephales promelas]|nr:zinc finger and SCAN domain containing 2-like [Pimephales promelas]